MRRTSSIVVAQRVKKRPIVWESSPSLPFRMTRVGLRPIQFPGTTVLRGFHCIRNGGDSIRLSNFKADVRSFFPVPALPLRSGSLLKKTRLQAARDFSYK